MNSIREDYNREKFKTIDSRISISSPIFSHHDRPLVLGHRGVPEKHQENTMAGFKLAVELGLDGVELDIFLTKDKKLVVFHDVETERLTGHKGIITEMTCAEISELEINQKIDVGDKEIDYKKKEKIVLLEDVLEEVRGKLIVDIEIKAYSLIFGQRQTGAELAKLIDRMDLYKDVFVTSFNFWPLVWLEKTHSKIESGFTYSPVLIKPGGILHNIMESSFIGKRVGSTLTNMSLGMFDEDTVERVHSKNLAVGAWTIYSQDSTWLGTEIAPQQEFEYIKDLTQRGIDYFITDDPVRLRNTLSELS